MPTLERTRDLLSSFLREVGHKTGHHLELDDNDICGLDCKNGLTCGVILLDEERVGFFSPVLEMTGMDKARLFDDLLGMNLFYLEPKGASIAYDRKGNRVLFCLTLGIDGLSSGMFSETLGLFIKAAGTVISEINDIVRQKGTDRSDDRSGTDNIYQYIRV